MLVSGGFGLKGGVVHGEWCVVCVVDESEDESPAIGYRSTSLPVLSAEETSSTTICLKDTGGRDEGEAGGRLRTQVALRLLLTHLDTLLDSVSSVSSVSDTLFVGFCEFSI